MNDKIRPPRANRVVDRIRIRKVDAERCPTGTRIRWAVRDSCEGSRGIGGLQGRAPTGSQQNPTLQSSKYEHNPALHLARSLAGPKIGFDHLADHF